MSDLTDFHCQRLGTLRSARGNWETQWEEAASYALPAYRNTFQGNATARAEGDKKTEAQFAGEVGVAAQRFASVMESLATPQNAIWHLLKPIDPVLKRNRSARMFFDDLSERLYHYRYRPSANFVGNSQQTYLSLGVFGNGSLFVDAPDNEKGLRYRNMHLGETYWVENHAGIVDTVYRAFALTARQIIQKWPQAPAMVQEAAKNATQMERKFEVLHCIYPREDYSPGRVDALGMRFASLYILHQTKDLLSEGGFNTWPYPTTRYTQMSGELYGRGPAQYVLAAIKVLNEEKRTVLKQGHRIVDPVLLAHDDGNLDSFSLKAGSLNRGGISKDGKRLVDVLPTGNLAVAFEMMGMESSLINDAFLINLFQILVDTPQMTATEVLERAREKGMLLAPMAGRFQAEFLGPLIEREIDLLARQGLLPPVPSILRDAAIEYHIDYDSPMSRMARAEKASGFMRALSTAAEYAKMTNDLEPLDWFNFDEAMPEILDIHGAPIKWTRSIEEVMSRRDGRAQQAQEQTAVEALPGMAAIAKVQQGAKA